MNRRDFVRFSSMAAVTAAGSQSLVRGEAKNIPHSPPEKARMKLGTQFGAEQPSDDTLRALAEFGVSHICSGLPSPHLDDNWSVEGLTRLRERVESFGIKLEMVPLPMSSSTIDKGELPGIMLGKSPERDSEVDAVCHMIRNVGRVGIPAVKYNFSILGVVRTRPTLDRGGALYSTFNYSEAMSENLPLTEAEAVSIDEMWERITYFLKRVVPVAEESKVKMACHPEDPGMPRDKGFRGVHRVLGHVDGLKRLIEIMPSPYHGLNFCQGTVSEMLPKPDKQIYDVIRYFGSRRKIFNVHFRNIRGGFLNFKETFPDNGSVNMVKAMRIYKEVGYDGMMMPDHVPNMRVPAGRVQAFAFEYGYIRGLIQAMENES